MNPDKEPVGKRLYFVPLTFDMLDMVTSMIKCFLCISIFSGGSAKVRLRTFGNVLFRPVNKWKRFTRYQKFSKFLE